MFMNFLNRIKKAYLTIKLSLNVRNIYGDDTLLHTVDGIYSSGKLKIEDESRFKVSDEVVIMPTTKSGRLGIYKVYKNKLELLYTIHGKYFELIDAIKITLWPDNLVVFVNHERKILTYRLEVTDLGYKLIDVNSEVVVDDGLDGKTKDIFNVGNTHIYKNRLLCVNQFGPEKIYLTEADTHDIFNVYISRKDKFILKGIVDLREDPSVNRRSRLSKVILTDLELILSFNVQNKRRKVSQELVALSLEE